MQHSQHRAVSRKPLYSQTPLWRDSQRLLVDVEVAVRGFSRYHKYTVGAELRTLAMDVCRLVARAAQTSGAAQRRDCVERLVWRVEDLKLTVQLGKELQA